MGAVLWRGLTMHISFFVPLAVCSALLFQHVTQGSGSMVRRRRVRKFKQPQEIQRSARKLDLDQISINQDFNTEFVKAFLYGDSPRSIEKEEGVRPIFATRQGEHRAMKNLEMRREDDDVSSSVTDNEDGRIGRLLEFPFNSLEKQTKISTNEDHLIQSDGLSINNNLIVLGDNDDLYAINQNDEFTSKTNKQIVGAYEEVQDYNEYDYEENERLDQDLNYRTIASSKQSEQKFVEVFDDFENKNIHEFDALTKEDIIVTPHNHNGELPYHLEGTIGRISKQTKNPDENSQNTANVNYAFGQPQLYNDEGQNPETNMRIRGALKNEKSADGIIRFNGNQRFPNFGKNIHGYNEENFSRESRKVTGENIKHDQVNQHRDSRQRFSENRSQSKDNQNHNLNRESRQGSDENSGAKFDEVAAARPDNSGQKCINKVVLETETQYDEIIECKHSYDKRCHTTFSTDYEPTQEEKCDENYRKNCFIEYSTTAYNETVQICRQPLLKDCNLSGPEICRTEYESECWTRNEVHDVTDDVVECTEVKEEKCEDETSGYTTQQKCSLWPVQKCEVKSKQVKKFTPKTKCTKIPKELCAPAGCGFTPGPEECFDKVQTVLGQHPEEQCSLEPQTTCKHVTKLVPKLVAREECLDVPKEVCTRSKSNPRRIQKPVVKKWCYTPSEESGLA